MRVLRSLGDIASAVLIFSWAFFLVIIGLRWLANGPAALHGLTHYSSGTPDGAPQSKC